MSIQIDENLLGLWFVSFEDADWMAGAWRKPGGGFAGAFRFRFHRDEKAFGSEDRKEWYDVNLPAEATEAEVIQGFSEMASEIELRAEGRKWELIRGTSTLEQFAKQLMELPFAHTKTVTPKECRVSMQEKGTKITVTVVHKATGKRATATGPASQKQLVKFQALKNLGKHLYAQPAAH